MISPAGSVRRQVGIFAHLAYTVASRDAGLAQMACFALMSGFGVNGFATHSNRRLFAALATVACCVATLAQVTARLGVRIFVPQVHGGIFAH